MLHAELIQAKLEDARLGQSTQNLEILQKVASAIVHDTQCAAGIIRKLRNLFRMRKGEYTVLKLDELVQDVLDLVHSKMKQADIGCTVELDPDLCVHGDATQLQQVILNLLNNAIDVLIESGGVKPQLQIRGKASGAHLNLEVEDNGQGIAPEHAQAVLSLFKSFKSQGMGVGLWLSAPSLNLENAVERARGCCHGGQWPGAMRPQAPPCNDEQRRQCPQGCAIGCAAVSPTR